MTSRTIIVAIAAFVAGCVAAQQAYPQQAPGPGYPPQGNPGGVYPGGGYPIGPAGRGYPNQGYPNTGYPNQGYPAQYPNQGNPNAAQAPADQPGPPVARLSVMSGDASVKRNGSNDWMAAVVNAPLMAGDAVATGPNGQVEIELDASNFLRLAGDSEVRLADLGGGPDPAQGGRAQIQVARGLIMFRGLRISSVQTEISTPSVAVRPLGLAAVRVEVAPDGSTRITVRKGEVEASTPKGTERVREGSVMMVRGAIDDPEYQVVGAPARDGWDSWNEQRDAALERAQSNRYVPQGTYGAEDLDAAGRWGYDPQYGNVWTPSNVPPGWAPYSNGEWVASDFYGWTWVDAAPWGWAPFHYGSWYFRGGIGWSWFPGARYGRGAFYRPALVSFVGIGGGFGVGVGFGFGRIGWVPLAPFEAFSPWYGRGFAGGGRIVPGVNVVSNANIGALYRNARVANGVTAVSAQDFQRGAFRNASGVGVADLQRASLVRGSLPVAPGASNFRLSDRAATVAPQGNLNSQRFFSRTGNAGATAGGRVGAVSGNGGAGGFRAAQPSGTQGNSGWQRFGEPGAGGARNGFNGAPAGSGSNGWDRFGTPQQGSAQQRFSGAPQQNGRSDYPSTGNFSGGGGGYGGNSRPLQVAPPIVRQRQAAPSGGQAGGGYRGGNSGGRPSGGGGRGGGRR